MMKNGECMRKNKKLLFLSLVFICFLFLMSTFVYAKTVVDYEGYLYAHSYKLLVNGSFESDIRLNVKISTPGKLCFYICDGGEMFSWIQGLSEPHWYYYNTSVTNYLEISIDLSEGSYDLALFNPENRAQQYSLVISYEIIDLSPVTIFFIILFTAFITIPFVSQFLKTYIFKHKNNARVSQSSSSSVQVSDDSNSLDPPHSFTTKVCPNCSADIPIDSVYCPDCGFKQA